MNYKKNELCYEIMLKDTVVASINISNGFATIKENALPFDLKLKANIQTIEDSIENILSFKEWCASRTLMMSQKHAKKICNALAISQDVSVENKARIAIAYHCSTLQDSYWIKQKGSSLTYEEVSLFRNTSRNVLTPVSLRGEVDSIFTNKLKNWSDIGADGTLAKSWIREDGAYYLYKTGDNLDGEVLASNLLKQAKANAVAYIKTKNKDVDVVKCECFTNEDTSFIPYRTFARAFNGAALKFIKDNFLEEYANMVVATYLTGNEDLHDKNWGIVTNPNTGDIKGLAPLFDFDGCFVNYKNSKNLKFLPECVYVSERNDVFFYNDWNMEDYRIEGPTIEEAALQYAPFASVEYTNIDLDTIPEAFRDELERRITKLTKQKSKEILDAETERE